MEPSEPVPHSKADAPKWPITEILDDLRALTVLEVADIQQYVKRVRAARGDRPSPELVSQVIAAVERLHLTYAYRVPISLGCGSGRIDAGSSVFGPALDTTAWPTDASASMLESVGIEAPGGKVCPGIYAAGDVVAGKRRTMLDAVVAGLRAGRMV